MTITVFLVAVVLYQRILYGQMLITKITTRPYVIAIVLLCVQMIEGISLLYMYRVQYYDDLESFLKSFTEDIFTVTIHRSFAMIKYWILIVFIMSRVFEHLSLIIFVYYQQKYRL